MSGRNLLCQPKNVVRLVLQICSLELTMLCMAPSCLLSFFGLIFETDSTPSYSVILN